MSDEIIIAGIGGSLRKESYNAFLLRESARLMPEGSELKIIDISSLPMFNADRIGSRSEVVDAFRESIRSCHGLLFATPEYNYSIPGFLKNAIDVASIPSSTSPFRNRAAGIISASQGHFGGMRAQYHLRQVLVYLEVIPLARPEFFVHDARSKFGSDGMIVDEELRERLRKYLDTLVTFTRKVSGDILESGQ